MEYYVILCDWIKHYQFYKISEVNGISILNLFSVKNCMYIILHVLQRILLLMKF